MSMSEVRHRQEPTALSMTETVNEDEGAATTQDSSGKKVGLEDIEVTTSPQSLFGSVRRPPPHERTATLDPTIIPPFIPPTHPNRTLVLCFDGTGDQFDADNSNIVQLVSLLKKDDRSKQMVYYQTGIGTYTSPKIATPLSAQIHKTLDTMFATSLHAHVMGGYEFLMHNYAAGDKICIFGFSRGAYTARSLAGMLHKVGLLPPHNDEQVPFAYQMYLRTDEIGWEQSNEFKKAFSINVDIEFVGVWDTVDSVGIVPAIRLPFTTSNTLVKTFRHAVSLDERRAKFKANLWNRPTAEEEKLGLPGPSTPVQLPERSFSKATSVESNDFSDLFYRGSKKKPAAKTEGEKGNGNAQMLEKKGQLSLGFKAVDSADDLLNTFERIHSQQGERKTDIEEVWFAGCHCDIGGGSVSNKTRHSLARIPLRWMIREIFKAKVGMLFDSDKLFETGMDPATLYPYVLPRPDPLPVGDRKIRSPPVKEIPIRPHSTLTKKNPNSTLSEVCKPYDRDASDFLGEEEEELMDALSPIYDRLVTKKAWRILEYIPLHLRYQRGDNTWVSYYGLNRASPRHIPLQSTNGVKIHRSVKLRMEAEYEDEVKRRKGTRYNPRPDIHVTPTWVG
ncbi:hypothetical protein DFP72DRAFT_1169843 [Ephemerocybe angulata]|uniref:T6SS Phospholipase effector Tle1-like catalytic domain-containing protein n=1 Tax=Ephemerocybe angulata TaxID=980116 RepID=A0A8H6M892_9AGAR|nr:hypothetical protein DFP72DRAFT_1169843 [Tulosesus angulatus]